MTRVVFLPSPCESHPKEVWPREKKHLHESSGPRSDVVSRRPAPQSVIGEKCFSFAAVVSTKALAAAKPFEEDGEISLVWNNSSLI